MWARAPWGVTLFSVCAVLCVLSSLCALFSVCSVLGVRCSLCALFSVCSVLCVCCSSVCSVLGVRCSLCALFSVCSVLRVRCSLCVLFSVCAVLRVPLFVEFGAYTWHAQCSMHSSYIGRVAHAGESHAHTHTHKHTHKHTCAHAHTRTCWWRADGTRAVGGAAVGHTQPLGRAPGARREGAQELQLRDA